jgi:hypothetical protein
MNKKFYLTMFFLLSSALNTNLLANEFSEEGPIFANNVEIHECETLSYQASLVTSNNESKEEEIKRLVSDAIYTCYHTYRDEYNQLIRSEKGNASPGSPAYRSEIAIKYTKLFAEDIINQIDSLAQKLEPEDRQIFWTCASTQVTTSMQSFLRSHGCQEQAHLKRIESHISNLINMKKVFG